MIFQPQELKITEGSFMLSKEVGAIAHPCLNNEIIREFFYNFTYRSSTLKITDRDELIFRIGSAGAIPLGDYDYSINVEKNGICIYAATERDLKYGFMTLIDRLYAVDGDDGLKVGIECCRIKDRPVISNRMIHFCIFPETELWELKRLIRFCGALKYTHVVLEFWGMLKYDCLKELSWRNGFTKEQIRPIIKEANELSLEIIPMFNHWGHASAGRERHGKHVVLDQNPTLQTYFTEDGWCWDIKSPKVKELLRKIRNELTDLCGEGSYFHIGCDEAYNFEFTKENMDVICDYINEISDEMRLQGRRAIMWGDMLLFRHPHFNSRNIYTCNAPSAEAEKYMLDRLSRDIVIADWQYDAVQSPVETASTFMKAGFDCLLCPWDRGVAQMNSVISTIKEQTLKGFLHTTWHTLSNGMSYITLMAARGFDKCECSKDIRMNTYTAALLRKVLPAEGDYSRSGWSKIQVGDLW